MSSRDRSNFGFLDFIAAYSSGEEPLYPYTLRIASLAYAYDVSGILNVVTSGIFSVVISGIYNAFIPSRPSNPSAPFNPSKAPTNPSAIIKYLF